MSKQTAKVATSLRRGIGRRLLALLALAAIVPIAVVAVLLPTRVADDLLAQRHEELRQTAATYGSAVAERLARAADLFGDAAASARPHDFLVHHVGRELDGFVLLDAAGRPLSLHGRVPNLALVGAASIDAALQSRQPILLLDGAGPAPELMLLQARRAEGGTPLLALLGLRADYLWGSRAALSPGIETCVLLSAGNVLHCSREMPEATLLRSAQLSDEGLQPAALRLAGVTYRFGAINVASTVPVLAPGLTVAAALPEAVVLAPAREVLFTFVPAAIAGLLAVLVLAVTQIRRVQQPLESLLAGTQRVAVRKFDQPVPVYGNDEFARLTLAFNRMTDQLGLHFRTLTAFSEIDRTILTAPDIRQVAEIALDCIQEIARVKVVSLGLVDPEAPHRTNLYVRSDEHPTIHEELKQALDLGVADASNKKWSRALKLPREYRKLLLEHGAQSLYLLPIARADTIWGVVALGHGRSASLSRDQVRHLAGVVDRLAVALSSVSRDRQLHAQAHYDALTKLPNRHYLMEMLKQQISHAGREQRNLAVLYIDLDRFKRTNDTLGHAAGDILLQQAAKRIREKVRSVDIVARLGGDEFTVVLTRLKRGAHDAGRIARALIAELSEPFDIEGNTMYAGASIGIALFPNDGADEFELLKRADTALYLAKDRGRGRYAFFEERMNADASARATIDRELREALKRDEFVLFYQPQIDLATGEVSSVEALLRWRHPQRGMIAPGGFIEEAEESGLIEAIGTWAVREACAQHRRWSEAGTVIPRVSVNVSSLQLRNVNFAATVEGALKSAAVAPHHLELEITESLIIEAGHDAVAMLERLRALGVEIAVDDFGTGYSSFAYVKQLPANVLKLDRSFIVDVLTDQDAATIAASIINMAHALRKTVVAEGVETPQQVQFLKRLNCARAQGFVFSFALPAEQIPQFVLDRGLQPEPPARPPLHLVPPVGEVLSAA